MSNLICGKFAVGGNYNSTHDIESPDENAFCDFTYNIKTKEYEVSNCNKSEEEILPLPLYWLDIKLEQNGSLKSQESKISY